MRFTFTYPAPEDVCFGTDSFTVGNEFSFSMGYRAVTGRVVAARVADDHRSVALTVEVPDESLSGLDEKYTVGIEVDR